MDSPDRLIPSTMVAMIHFDSWIDLESIFWTFPVVSDPKDLIKKAPPRSRFKWLGSYGSILSMFNQNRHRGVVKDKKLEYRKKDMENGIEMNISLEYKNINICLYYSKKLGISKIRVTGAKSIDMIEETYAIIKNHLIKTQERLQYIKDHPEILGDLIENMGEDLRLGETLDPNLQVYLEALPFIDNRATFIRYCEAIKKIDSIYKGNLDSYQIYEVNVNYDYRLDFKINRKKLYRLSKGKYNFFSSYSKVKNHYKVVLQLAVEYLSRPFKKKTKKPCHTFRVNQSGCVKQISPNLELGYEAYCQFLKLIIELQEEIKSP